MVNRHHEKAIGICIQGHAYRPHTHAYGQSDKVRKGDAINRKLYMDNDEAMDPEWMQMLHTDIDIDDDDGDDNAFGSIAADTVNDFKNEYPMREARAACAATNAFISRVTRPLSDHWRLLTAASIDSLLGARLRQPTRQPTGTRLLTSLLGRYG